MAKFDTKTITLTEARANFSQLVRQVASSKIAHLIGQNSKTHAALVNADRFKSSMFGMLNMVIRKAAMSFFKKSVV